MTTKIKPSGNGGKNFNARAGQNLQFAERLGAKTFPYSDAAWPKWLETSPADKTSPRLSSASQVDLRSKGRLLHILS
jgi:hypothetical protein